MPTHPPPTTHRRLLLFPKGNQANKRGEFMSLFLDAGDLQEQEYPIGWQRIAHFDLILVNQEDDAKSIRKSMCGWLSGWVVKWGGACVLGVG